MNAQILFKTIFILLCIALIILALGLLVAFLYLLLQVFAIMISACLVSIALTLLVQYIYCSYRISLLMKCNAALMTARFDDKTQSWHWQPDAGLNVYIDTGIAKLLGLIVGFISALIFLIKLKSNGSFNKQVWWFLGHASQVPEQASMILASLLLLLALAITFAKLSCSVLLKKYLNWHADSFVSTEDRLNLGHANNLFKMAMQYYAEAKHHVQGSANLSLMMELEQIFSALTSDNLASLVQARKWQEFKIVAEGILADLQRLKASSNSWQNFWHSNINETDEEKACRILGVSINASNDEIREAYRKLALLWHPDRNGGNGEKMKEVNWAYDVLKNARQFA